MPCSAGVVPTAFGHPYLQPTPRRLALRLVTEAISGHSHPYPYRKPATSCTGFMPTVDITKKIGMVQRQLRLHVTAKPL